MPANYKMIAALAVRKLDRKESESSLQDGLTGWAPTQGHIHQEVPYIRSLQKERTFWQERSKCNDRQEKEVCSLEE